MQLFKLRCFFHSTIGAKDNYISGWSTELSGKETGGFWILEYHESKVSNFFMIVVYVYVTLHKIQETLFSV